MALSLRSMVPLLVLAGGVAGLTLYWQWLAAAVPVAPTASAIVTAPLPVVPSPLLQTAKPVISTARAPASLPGLQGTDVDGELKADSAGNLQLNLALRDYLDYFLSAADQAGLETVVEVMLADARARLPEPALGQFIGLLGDYMDYKRASLALLQQPLSSAQQSTPDGQLVALQRAFDQLAQLRRAHFSSAATEALFGAEEAYGRYTLDNLALMARDDLSEHGKALAQERLRAQLPEAMRASEERQVHAQALQAQTDKLWQEGASEEQVRQLLALTYDPPTVQRLLSEQRNERAWQQRYATYQQELAALQGNGLSAADRQQEQQRLRQRLFSAEDQHRVEAYDAIATKLQDNQPPEL
ncbi:lipase chaperone [Pseudomonas sp. HMWF032]|uniref:lipase secretion chaperone n=1 Tax=Pseudomonas sp. HMWF032 TaxID=2056866 RepID=UPI000D3B0A02|nr:lipase secretion chaperone [Pseudomonas sp. HMWF032]PTS84341.1 lipase chaperone [Pseudomonas sp. HMWF032]PTT77832.1 lipase chaperone [Pseudomonas sp. HMWF010]